MVNKVLAVIWALFIGLLITGPDCFAQNSAKETVVNEILFSVSGEPSTSRDLSVFKAVLSEVFQIKKISQFSKKSSDDFLLSRLAYKEAQVFELNGSKTKEIEERKKKINEFSPTEVEREIEIISKALALVEIKESQLKQHERFDTWYELLKRKYQLKIKSSEIK